MKIDNYNPLLEVPKPLHESAIERYQQLNSTTTHSVTKEEAVSALTESERSKKRNHFLGLSKEGKPTSEKNSNLLEYLQQYSDTPEWGEYLFGKRFLLNNENAKKNTKRKFVSINSRFKYFDTENDTHQALYWECVKFCLYQATFIESNVVMDEVYRRAYNMMVLFSPELSEKNPVENIKKTIACFKSFATKHMYGALKPVHDILMHGLPVYSSDRPGFNLKKWKESFFTLGMIGLKHFTGAQALENEFNQEWPGTVDKFKEVLKKIRYPGFENYPALADVFERYNINREIWMRTVKLIQSKKLHLSSDGELASKTSDNIPDVMISVPSRSENSYYYFLKLPSKNLRSLILGEITNCCQSIAGDSERCVIDGVNESNNGFFVLIKTKHPLIEPIDWRNFEKNGHQIVGQSYVWKGKRGDLVLDSLEILQGARDQFDLPELFRCLMSEANRLDESIVRILLGMGGGSEGVMSVQKLTMTKNRYPDSMLTGKQYSDSVDQSEVGVLTELEELRDELRKKTPFKNQGHIISLSQTRILNPDYDDFLKKLDQGDEKYYRFCLSLFITKANQWVTFSEVRELGIDKTSILISKAAIECYENGWVTFADLKGLKPDEIDFFTNRDARDCYKNGWITFSDLKVLDLDKRMLLMSYKIHDFYKKHWVSLGDLKDLDMKKIELLTGCAVNVSYENVQPTKKIVFTNYSKMVEKCYENGWATFADLKDLEAEKIAVLISDDRIECYKNSWVTFADLKDLDIARIKALTNDGAQECYKNGWATFADLKTLIHSYSAEDIPRLEDKLKVFVAERKNATQPSGNFQEAVVATAPALITTKTQISSGDASHATNLSLTKPSVKN